MKPIATMFTAILALGLFAGAAMAQSDGSTVAEFDANGHVLPVLVAVNSRGKVTNVEPAITLHSAQQESLEKAVQSMIKAPARNKDGSGKASQFVMMFVINDAQGSQGAPTFTYMDARPVQTGSLHWVNIGSSVHRRYALARQPAGSMEDRGAYWAELNNARNAASSSGGE